MLHYRENSNCDGCFLIWTKAFDLISPKNQGFLWKLKDFQKKLKDFVKNSSVFQKKNSRILIKNSRKLKKTHFPVNSFTLFTCTAAKEEACPNLWIGSPLQRNFQKFDVTSICLMIIIQIHKVISRVCLYLMVN